MLDTLRESVLLGNSYFDYLLAALYAISGLFALVVIKSVVFKSVKKLAEKTSSQFDDGMVRLVRKYVMPPLYFVVVYFSVQTLSIPQSISKVLTVLIGTIVTLYIIRFILQLIKFFIFEYWIPSKPERQQFETQFRALMPFVSFLVWASGLVFLIDNLGFNISTVVTGLGIGGVAVALAASAVLGDLFAYFTILFDKPFVLGDFIIVDNYLGSIENVGIKTTRIRSLGGEEIIFSNKALTDSKIRNYKRMEQRRIVFKLGTTYSTSLDKMKKIPDLIKDVIGKINDTKFDRAHFLSFGDFSLNIEVVYYVLSNDYNKYMDIQQDINFKLKEAFEKHGIEFAFPTQTLHIEKSSPA